MDIKAAVAFEAGEPLKVETVQLEGPKAGEVLVDIKSTGVCHTDEYTRSGADPEGLFPSVLGHEGAGVVVAAGDSPEAQALLGKTVGFPGEGTYGEHSIAVAQMRPQPCAGFDTVPPCP